MHDGMNVLTLIGVLEKYSVFGKGSYVKNVTAWRIEIYISCVRPYICAFIVYYSAAQKFLCATTKLGISTKIYGKRSVAILLADHAERKPKG